MKICLDKKAKSAKVEFKEIPCIRIVAHYQCPSCKTFHEDGTIDKNIIRFRCSHCGQEIIIEEVKPWQHPA